MRITGGIYKGRKIICPPGVIRPAMDRMRESLFAILGDLDGLTFLDLFSGSGVVGIEAVSRGAKKVVMVEKDYRKRGTLYKNCSFVESGVEIRITDVYRFIGKTAASFDVIFIDPPFAFQGKPGILKLIDERGLLSGDGRLVIHVPKQEETPYSVGRLVCHDRRFYGGSALFFFSAET
ncbi:MAG: 16S rRNA (guanine(966)-N(2))-methyltransferase RsmD [Spirochaetales bacterium]|nr:16S rRNA (guanine(966)-N(2))-methyltransferase RsmD [Spirochaetales bacterium]